MKHNRTFTALGEWSPEERATLVRAERLVRANVAVAQGALDPLANECTEVFWKASRGAAGKDAVSGEKWIPGGWQYVLLRNVVHRDVIEERSALDRGNLDAAWRVVVLMWILTRVRTKPLVVRGEVAPWKAADGTWGRGGVLEHDVWEGNRGAHTRIRCFDRLLEGVEEIEESMNFRSPASPVAALELAELKKNTAIAALTARHTLAGVTRVPNEGTGFMVTRDLRATSDKLWQQLFAFRAMLLDGKRRIVAEWQDSLWWIRIKCDQVGLRSSASRSVLLTLKEAAELDPLGSWSDDTHSDFACVLYSEGEDGWIELHDLTGGFRTGRSSAIVWAESWMSARERQICQSEKLDLSDATIEKLMSPRGLPKDGNRGSNPRRKCTEAEKISAGDVAKEYRRGEKEFFRQRIQGSERQGQEEEVDPAPPTYAVAYACWRKTLEKGYQGTVRPKRSWTALCSLAATLGLEGMKSRQNRKSGSRSAPFSLPQKQQKQGK